MNNLNKKEQFALAAMQAILTANADNEEEVNVDEVVDLSVKIADAMATKLGIVVY